MRSLLVTAGYAQARARERSTIRRNSIRLTFETSCSIAARWGMFRRRPLRGRSFEKLYDGVMDRARDAFDKVGVKGYIMCHLAHSYHSGACLYFTFAFRPTDDARSLQQYDAVKQAIQQGFIDFGGTLSHHHGVGVEHAQWLSQDISPVGVTMIRSLLDGMDPNHNFNPGKIV